MQTYVVSIRHRRSTPSTTAESKAKLSRTRMQRFADKLDRLLAQPDWAGHLRGTPCYCPDQNVAVLTCSLALAEEIRGFSNVKSIASEETDGSCAA